MVNFNFNASIDRTAPRYMYMYIVYYSPLNLLLDIWLFFWVGRFYYDKSTNTLYKIFTWQARNKRYKMHITMERMIEREREMG